MKNRNTVGNPTLPQESQLGEDDITLSNALSVEATNVAEPIEPSESATPKKLKKSPIADPVIQKFIKDSEERAKKRNELRQNLVAAETQK